MCELRTMKAYQIVNYSTIQKVKIDVNIQEKMDNVSQIKPQVLQQWTQYFSELYKFIHIADKDMTPLKIHESIDQESYPILDVQLELLFR